MNNQTLPENGSAYVPYRDFHSTEWTRVITSLKELSPSDKVVVTNLAGRAGLDGVCHPSINTIARDTGLNPKTVKRSIARMRDRGFISWISGDVRKNQANEYAFLWNEALDARVNQAMTNREEDKAQDQRPKGEKRPLGQTAPRGEMGLPKENNNLKTNQEDKKEVDTMNRDKSIGYLGGHSDVDLPEAFEKLAEEMRIPSSSWSVAYSFTVERWGDEPGSAEMIDALTIWKQSGTMEPASQLVGSGGYSADTRAYLGEELIEALEQEVEEERPSLFLLDGVETTNDRKRDILSRVSNKVA